MHFVVLSHFSRSLNERNELRKLRYRFCNTTQVFLTLLSRPHSMLRKPGENEYRSLIEHDFLHILLRKS